MARIDRRGISLLLALALVGIAAGGTVALAESRDTHRAETWEMTIPVRYINGETLDFDHGTSVELNSDFGWGFGLGYNLSEKLNLNMEFAWTSANYRVNYTSADDPPIASVSASGTLDMASTQFNLTYYFRPSTITPYVSAGFGWTWVDSNIPAGPPVGSCWWDPWYGYICGGYQATYSTTAFSYGLGAGLRIEPKETFFLRIGINDNWQDLGDYSGSPDFLSYRFDVGWRF